MGYVTTFSHSSYQTFLPFWQLECTRVQGHKFRCQQTFAQGTAAHGIMDRGHQKPDLKRDEQYDEQYFVQDENQSKVWFQIWNPYAILAYKKQVD
jgi:hypothetical protein